jgi:hypothetical protein
MSSQSNSITAAIAAADAAYGRYQYRTPLSSLPHRVFRLNSPPDYLIPDAILAPLLASARALSLLLHHEGIDVPELAALDKALTPLATIDR